MNRKPYFLLALFVAGMCASAFGQADTVRTGRFFRGTGTNANFHSFVVPLDGQEGLECTTTNGQALALLPYLVSYPTSYHYNATNPASITNVSLRIPYRNPIAMFGSRAGGSPLYFGERYRFEAYAGDVFPFYADSLVLWMYQRTNGNIAFRGFTYIPLPNPYNTNDWTAYLTNGYTKTFTTNGLTTIITYNQTYTEYGASVQGQMMLTHVASSAATNFIFQFEVNGSADGGSHYLVVDSAGSADWSRLYTVEFEPRPPTQAVFIDQPHFDGDPLPSAYLNKTLAELLTNPPPVATTFSLSNAPTTYTNLDTSPELRRHPILDQFVSDMRRDPVALARYVHNEIELTDALSFNDNGSITETSVNPPGVSRGALGTYLEGQGGPAEQCALLIYLLRQAGVPAVYVYPPHNGLKMLDSQLSKVLRMQFKGAVNNSGVVFTTNTLISVNYPWVAAYVGTNWVHLFPWLKDTSIEEGLNLADYMGTQFPTSMRWVEAYVKGDTNILSLADGDDTAGALFPRWLQKNLDQIAPGVSLDDIGVRWINRPHTYARWTDFPRPFTTPTNGIALDNLSSPAITNVFAGLTNIFDTFSVEVASRNTTKKVSSGELRMLDLHNRQFVVRHVKTGANLHDLILSLASFRTNATGPTNFTAGDTLLNLQFAKTNLTSTDDTFDVKLVYKRHRSLPISVFTNLPFANANYPRMDGRTVLSNSFSIRKGDLATICLNVGRVTRAMLNTHAEDLWNMERTLEVTPSATNSLSPDLYQGGAAYLMGMAYHESTSRFAEENQRLNKARIVSHYAQGLAKLSAKRVSGALPNNGDVILNQPGVDMVGSQTALAFSGTLHPDSGEDGEMAAVIYNDIGIAHDSSEEHQILNSFFRESDSISTVKLLQLAQSRANPPTKPGVLTLNNFNYVQMGNSNISGTLLKNYDTTVWASVTNFFVPFDKGLRQVFITPGSVTNKSNSYKGMGALMVSPGVVYFALISPNQNGGAGPIQPDASYTAPNTVNYALQRDPFGNLFLTTTAPGASSVVQAPDSFANYNVGNVANNASQNYYAYSQFQNQLTANAMDYLGLNSQGAFNLNYAQAVQATGGDPGLLSWLSDALSQSGSHVADPVHAVTGEFYIQTSDLTLPGPMPLTISRNYSSLNLANNEFGFGWKLNYMPYLSINSGSNIIYAAEADGAVVAYEKTATNANVYLPTTAKNPQLSNNRDGGIGSVANRLRNRIEKQISGPDTFYYLSPPTGGKRTFKVMTFSGGGINRTRPYLTRWEDSRGNAFTFEYGTDSTKPDFGEARRIQSSNGSFLGLVYDVYGHIIEAYTGDGRRLRYTYDQFGDLVKLTLPDVSEIQYEYEHKTQNITNGVTVTTNLISTHLILKEIKPDGRVLKNEYDQNRRVTNQWSTVGADLLLVRNASFIYSNNYNLTNSFTNTITGFTIIKDVFNNTNRYDYTNGLITRITDPFNQVVTQDWYESSETNKAGYYPRSMESRTDQRGLITAFKYDSNGNPTNTVITGDLTGDGTIVSATNTTVYNADSLPTEVTDSAGNKLQTLYHPQYSFLSEYVIRFAGATALSSNKTVYQNVTNTFVSGGVTYTNMAFGVLKQEVRAINSPDAATNEWTCDGRGFVTQKVRYTSTADPAITSSFVYSDRGELLEQTDAAGRKIKFDYDPLGRPISREVYEAGQGVPISWEYSYYNDNGELTWSDGSRFNPEDYAWRDYDGAGRLITEIHWRSQAKADGTGVEAPTGNELYAQTFREYDGFGNLKRTIDPLGAVTTNTWDALGRLVQRKFFDTDGTTLLSTEGFAYEPGGQVRYYTNALSGVTETQYTTNGLPKFRRNADGSTNAWRYYVDGRIRREILGNGAYWETTYDDAAKKTTRIFYSTTGATLATNVSELDRRGNLVKRTDEAGNIFTNLFDGLDRIKIAAGPSLVSVVESCGSFPGCGVFVTNVVKQVITNFYDLAGITKTNINAIGEKTITLFDALGRITRAEVRDAGGTLVRETSTAYSSDHQSITITNGSGSAAIISTTYTDNDGHTALTIAYPATTVREFTRFEYDLAGNPSAQSRYVATNSASTFFSQEVYAYDGLHRIIINADRDFALTFFDYDAGSNLTNRSMPGNLAWSATYNSANQILTEKDSNGAQNTRNSSYTYYPSGDRWAGLRKTSTDGNGITRTNSYDDYLRVASVTTAGPLAEQKMSASWQYDPRGLLTSISQSFADTNAGPSTTIQRTYDAYSQLLNENGVIQSWDATGRRTLVGGISFQHRADGLMTSVGGATFGYATSGLLTGRTNGSRTVTIDQRDGIGRPLQVTTRNNLATVLTENWTWTGDGLPSTYTAARSDFTDTRRLTYGASHRRLTQETLNLSASVAVTNNYTFDSGSSGGLGVLTKAIQTGISNSWTGGLDSFSRLVNGTNTVIHRTADGSVNGAAKLRGYLNGQPIDLRYDSRSAGPWTADLNLQKGTNSLTVFADHPSGQFTTNKTAGFSVNSTAFDNESSQYDGAGNVTNRVWKNSLGQTVKSQTLIWDAFGRLAKVTERDGSSNGFNFVSIYDGLGRQAQTVETTVSNNVALASNPAPIVVSYTYDPQVEFLIIGIGVSQGVASRQDSLTYGPDISGSYGGMQGVGGLETITSGGLGATSIAINDAFGNVIANVTNGIVSWNTARLNLYGPMESYAPPRVSLASPTYSSLAWRTRALNVAGLVQLGTRPYDPIRRAFLSGDPLGHGADSALNTAFSGNPAQYFDPDGRYSKPANQTSLNAIDLYGANGGNVNVNDLFAVGIQNPNTPVTGTDLGSGWIRAGQLKAQGYTGVNYGPGYYDEMGFRHATFCYSCHDPNDPIAQLRLGAAFNTVNTSIPAFIAQNLLAFVPAEGMIGEVGVVANTVRQGASTTLLLTEGTLESRVGTVYQNFYNDAWKQVTADFNQGSIAIPAGQSWQTTLGQRTDAAARQALLRYLENQGISEGPGGQVLVNRRLYDPSGSGAYRIPDVRIPSAGVIFDGTIGIKTPATPQIQDFMNWSGSRVNIVTPTVLPGFKPKP